MEETILFQKDAQAKLLRGAFILKESVKGTLGPCGHHVIMQKGYGIPIVSNDGVSIAKTLHLKDPFEEMGAQLLLQAAIKTNETAGDGTTTSILLAHELLKHGYAYLNQEGAPNLFVQGMNEATQAISEYLNTHCRKIDTYEGIHHIASISAKSQEIGTLVADALKQVADPRCIYCESGKSYASKVRIQEGMEVEAAVLSPYFFPKDTVLMNLKNPYILISDERIDSIAQIESIFAFSIQERRPLLIFCEDMESDVLNALLMAHMQKKCNVVVVKAPSFGSYQQDILEDIALLCKGKAFLKDICGELSDMDVDDLGSCKEIILTPRSVQFMAKKHKGVDERIHNLKSVLPSLSQTYDIQHVYRRITRLEGKLARIEIGGYTESEIDEKKMRCEDALQAAYAAMEEGIVAGGGLAFIQAYRILQPVFHNENKDMESGIQCVFAAILKPFMQLIENNDMDSVTMLGIQFEKPHDIGYDVLRQQWCNLEDTGILDPVKVVLQTLHNAVSIASLLIRCDVAMLTTPNS